jgi:adenylate cyclase
LTIKSASHDGGLSRLEFEYSIPTTDADQLMLMCVTALEKIRHYVIIDGLTWEIDEYLGLNGRAFHCRS